MTENKVEHCDACGAEMSYGWVRKEPGLGDIEWRDDGSHSGLLRLYMDGDHPKLGKIRINMYVVNYNDDGDTTKDFRVCPDCISQFLMEGI